MQLYGIFLYNLIDNFEKSSLYVTCVNETWKTVTLNTDSITLLWKWLTYSYSTLLHKIQVEWFKCVYLNKSLFKSPALNHQFKCQRMFTNVNSCTCSKEFKVNKFKYPQKLSFIENHTEINDFTVFLFFFNKFLSNSRFI